MQIYKLEAIILKRKNIGEADRALTVFSKEHGKVRLIAKGIRKITSRRAPHLEIFSHVLLVVHPGKIWESISEAQTKETYENIRKDMKRVSIAYFFCELIDALLPEKQEHSDVFENLTSALQRLNAQADIYEQSKTFALELLWALGFLPRQKLLSGAKLQDFIENITERHLHTPHFARHVASW